MGSAVAFISGTDACGCKQEDSTLFFSRFLGSLFLRFLLPHSAIPTPPTKSRLPDMGIPFGNMEGTRHHHIRIVYQAVTQFCKISAAGFHDPILLITKFSDIICCRENWEGINLT